MCLCEISNSQSRAIFDPRVIIWTIFVKAYYMKLQTKYERPGSSYYTKDVLSFSPLWDYVKQAIPWAEYFWPKDLI